MQNLNKTYSHPVYLLPEKFFIKEENKSSLSSLPCISLECLDSRQHVWKVLILMNKVDNSLFNKIKACFDKTLLKMEKAFHQEEIEEKFYHLFYLFMITFDLSFSIFIESQKMMNPKEDEKTQHLYKLFNQFINYPSFRNKVLSFANLCLSNYQIEAYNQLGFDSSFLDQFSTQQEKELWASLTVYDSITTLYVKRFLERQPALNQEECLSSLRMIALTITIKASWDEKLVNSDFQPFIKPSIEQECYKLMEAEFLNTIEWDLSIND